MKPFLLFFCGVSVFAGCTAQQRAKSFGGTAEIEVPAGQKVVGATWKEDHLWYLTRASKPGEQPETLTLRESSSFGAVEGKVVFHEH